MDQKNQIQQDLISELGLDSLSPEKQQELAAKMTEVIIGRIFNETAGKLGEEDKEKYAKLLESQASSEEIENFLNEKIPDYDKLLQKVIDDFKEEMKKE